MKTPSFIAVREKPPSGAITTCSDVTTPPPLPPPSTPLPPPSTPLPLPIETFSSVARPRGASCVSAGKASRFQSWFCAPLVAKETSARSSGLGGAAAASGSDSSGEEASAAAEVAASSAGRGHRGRSRGGELRGASVAKSAGSGRRRTTQSPF